MLSLLLEKHTFKTVFYLHSLVHECKAIFSCMAREKRKLFMTTQERKSSKYKSVMHFEQKLKYTSTSRITIRKKIRMNGTTKVLSFPLLFHLFRSLVPSNKFPCVVFAELLVVFFIRDNTKDEVFFFAKVK